MTTARQINASDVSLANRSSTTGNFFSDQGANIQKLGDRVFLGSAVSQDGAAVPAQRTWVGLEANGYLTYFDTRSTAENISTIGSVAFAGAVRSSDGPIGMTTVPIAYAALAKNDITDATPANRKSAWGFYGLAYRAADGAAGAIAGAAQVAEFEIANLGAVVDTDPYSSLSSTSGVTYAAIFGSGGEYAQSGIAVNPASAAIHISGGNGGKFRKAINISAGAVDGTDGTTGLGDAITMAKGHQIVWFWSGADAARGMTIRSECNTLSYAMKMVGTSTGLRFYDQFDNTVVRILPAQLASGDGQNSMILTNSKVATGNPYIQGTGSDSAVGVDLVGQGKAQFNFYNQSKVRLLARVADVGALTTSSVNVLVLNANDNTADPYVGTAGGTNISVGAQGKGTGGFWAKDGAGLIKFQANTTGVGFFAATPVAKQALAAVLATDGSATSAQMSTAINAIRTALINYGLAA